MKRSKKLLYNTISSTVLQFVVAVCGLILPKLYLSAYGTKVNGLISSISHFLSVISFVEMGIGAVIASSLYKPIAEDDIDQISKIVTSGCNFYRRIAVVLSIYVLFLTVFFSITVGREFGWTYTTALVLIISISTLAQYLFGIMDQTFLNAAQMGYVHTTIRTVALLLNALLTYMLINIGANIHMVKLVSSCVFVMQPVTIRIILNKHYRINRNKKYETEPIKQKWNGAAQHISYVVLESADTIVLTCFSSLVNVSIYSLYYAIVSGIKQLINAFTRGMQHYIGDMIARNEKETLQTTFVYIEAFIHFASVFMFSCVGVLIIPFMRVYTKGISDANYIQPFFAIILVLANTIHTLRIPYSMLIMAAGHYKQTQNCYFISTAINLISSIIFVNIWGLVGVAMGTLLAMSYQTIWMIRYVSKNILKISILKTLKQFVVDAGCFLIIVLITSLFSSECLTFISWTILAIKVGIVSICVIALVLFLFYRKELLLLIKRKGIYL